MQACGGVIYGDAGAQTCTRKHRCAFSICTSSGYLADGSRDLLPYTRAPYIIIGKFDLYGTTVLPCRSM